jgi:glycosyltransferase involved in cell wall biosynthesis
MPVIEGIAHALPVIAAAGGGGSELVEHAVTGYFVDIEEGASLDAALMALVADGELRTRMGASGFQRYSQNSVASHAASFLKWAALF